jgi:predicted nuclease of restriction endonuclease-like (RecB) superfamily
LPDWYPELLDSISAHISHGHHRAIRAANTELLFTYWSIGREILDRQQQEGWGAKVIDRLSADLKARFPDARGYSPRNLKYMRALAAAWPEGSIVQRSAAQLPWRHHQYLLDKLSDQSTREWYAGAAIENGWSRDMLALHIEGRLHERAGRAITNFAATMPPEDSDLAQQATRDPYLFDFLSTTDVHRERDLERGLMDHVSRFLLELGQGFAFVGRQVRLELGGEEFFCDLLFYHLKLRCFVVIELKAVKFDPAFLGQLGIYMAAVDDLLAYAHDRPTIGLLLCKSKNNVVAEYALRGMTSPIGVAEWTDAVTTSLPDELSSTLPTIEELEAELAAAPDDPTPSTEAI